MTRTLLIVGLLLSTSSISAYAENYCTIAGGAFTQAVSIRKLDKRQEVPCFVHDKARVRKDLLETIQHKMPKQKLELEGLAYQVLGFVPEGYDYQRGIIDLYLENLGGYYDPEKNHFVMAGWLPAILQTPVAVHELTHALQDQHFDLDRFMDAGQPSDQLFARLSLVEGDATAVMVDYARGLVGQPPIAAQANVDALMAQNIIGSAAVSTMSAVPESLKMMLIFPYTSGLRFVHHFLRDGGYEHVSEMFRVPPRSTEEILHPEKYGGSPDFQIPTVAEVQQFSPIGVLTTQYTDTIGEFAIRALLSAGGGKKPQIIKASIGWDGDLLYLGKSQKATERYLFWSTRWSSPEDAAEFAALYDDLLRKRYPQKIPAGEWINVKSALLHRIARWQQGSVITYGFELH